MGNDEREKNKSIREVCLEFRQMYNIVWFDKLYNDSVTVFRASLPALNIFQVEIQIK
jgi:hypothetical protein